MIIRTQIIFFCSTLDLFSE